MPGNSRRIVRQRGLAEQCLRHTRAEQVRDADDLVCRAKRTRADEHRDLPAGVQDVGRTAQICIVRHDHGTAECCP